MISLLLAPMNPEALKAAPSHAYDDSMDAKPPNTNISHLARIKWCQGQKMKARSDGELDKWCAEEEGLKDALFHRDRTDQYHYGSPALLERYVTGLEDGQTLVRAALVESIWQPIRW